MASGQKTANNSNDLWNKIVLFFVGMDEGESEILSHQVRCLRNEVETLRDEVNRLAGNSTIKT